MRKLLPRALSTLRSNTFSLKVKNPAICHRSPGFFHEYFYGYLVKNLW